MKKIIAYVIILFLEVVSVISCSEPIELKTSKSDVTFFAVESILTDMPFSVQTVKLSESVPYFCEGETLNPAPVSGATVTVSDGEQTVAFKEDSSVDSGTYSSPRGFRVSAGKTYHLSVERTKSDGQVQKYEATTTAPELGCKIDSVGYMNNFAKIDSTWTLGIWGSCYSQKSNFLVLCGVNGNFRSIDRAFFIDNKYFSNSTVEGFPVTVLLQSNKAMQTEGPTAKPIELGDVFNVLVYTIPDDFYDYLVGYISVSALGSIPLISTQPSNLPTNIIGENAVGFFTACAVTMKGCVVTDLEKKKL